MHIERDEDVMDMVSKLNRFVLFYSKYLNAQRDYGTGYMINAVEVHILTNIYENPGITVTELSKLWCRTKGAISQTVKKIEDKGLVRREKKAGDIKTIHLYCTDSGNQLSAAHKQYDLIRINEILDGMGDKITSEQIEAFFAVLDAFQCKLGVKLEE